SAPDALKWNLNLRLASPHDNVPADLRGRAIASAAVLWLGELDAGRPILDHVRSLATPVSATSRTLSYLALQTMADNEFPHGRRYYTKSGYFKSLDDGSIARMVEALAAIPSPLPQIELAYLGGAPARVGAGDTAFGDRSSPFVLNLLANWENTSDDV